jgi:hypothetical protein
MAVVLAVRNTASLVRFQSSVRAVYFASLGSAKKVIQQAMLATEHAAGDPASSSCAATS